MLFGCGRRPHWGSILAETSPPRPRLTPVFPNSLHRRQLRERRIEAQHKSTIAGRRPLRVFLRVLAPLRENPRHVHHVGGGQK